MCDGYGSMCDGDADALDVFDVLEVLGLRKSRTVIRDQRQ